LRSADLQLLNLPASKTKFGSRAFRCSAPSIWNDIPLNVRNSPSIASFESNLKTYFCHPPAQPCHFPCLRFALFLLLCDIGSWHVNNKLHLHLSL
jgi:hypothetical protein